MNKCFQFSIPNVKKQYRFLFAFFLLFLPGFFNTAQAIIKHSTASGNWSDPASWSPYGVPQSIDNIIILSNHTITVDNAAEANSITIDENSELKFIPGKILTMHATLIVYGKVTMNNGDLHFSSGSFILGPNSTFTWEPNSNTSAGASLFTNGTEHFDPSSTLIIKKWYDYSSVPLGALITGDFGNLTLSSLSNGLLYEWNQNNQFETHKILGTLTIDQGWIVLDKSGSISNTSIGNISLTNPNSFLDFHKGTHNGSFIVTTKNITNIGGGLNGIYNGNGTIALNVTGNFYNLGNFKLIYNTGVFNVGNGNATLNVNGDFNQSAGDFRAIFNLTTTNAGVADLTFNNINLTGGIMMGHYACHTSVATCNFKVNGNLNINFSNATDKFRVVGLTSLSGIFNTAKANLTVNGNLLIAGNAVSEFTSSGGVGAEMVAIRGNTIISGGINNFNMGSHQVTFNNKGDFQITGGTTVLSKFPGNATVKIDGSFIQSSGILCVKGNTGLADVTVDGNFSLTNGTMFLHSNTITPSSNTINLCVNGNFTHTGGSINYDDNSASNGINNIYIKGGQYLLNGNGSITRAGAGISSVLGNLFFAKAGTIVYQRTVSSHSIQQVKQLISAGCTLEVISGNLQVSSHSQPMNDLLKISFGGILKMNSSKIVSNNFSAYSGITVDDNGRLILEHVNGLYNGTDNACISSTGNMNYFLASNSIVEYNGKTSQTLSGIGIGIATTTNHKYGKLEINLQGTTAVQNVFLNSSNVFIRKNLLLTKGELKLSNYTLNIESGAATAIARQSGYINSETTAAYNQGFLKWMHISNGTYIFPFGVSANEYIPFSFTPVSGSGDVQIATRATSPDNLPYPEGGSLPPVTNVKRNGIDISNSSVMDRWYDVIANGFTANVIVSYRGIENTTADSLTNAIFSMQSWNGRSWGPSAGSSIGVRAGTGTLTATNVSSFSHWMIATKTDITNSSDILDFNAVLNVKKVDIKWSVNSANNTGNFFIERSADQISFTEIGKVTATVETEELNSYSFNDFSPLEGISYYRLKRITDDNRVTYSETAIINYKDETQKDFTLISIFPNPFTDYINVFYSVPVASSTKISLMGANGQIIYSEEINSIKGKNTFQFFEKQKLLPGIYVLSIKYEKSVISKKLFKS